MKTQVVSITSQGRITIPSRFRKALKLKYYSKALVSLEGKGLRIEPIESILPLQGILANKKIVSQKRRRLLEKEAITRGYQRQG